MARTTINELKRRRLAGASAAERASFDETYAASALAVRVMNRFATLAGRPSGISPAPLDRDSYLE